jgi:hypothetical protein
VGVVLRPLRLVVGGDDDDDRVVGPDLVGDASRRSPLLRLPRVGVPIVVCLVVGAANADDDDVEGTTVFGRKIVVLAVPTASEEEDVNPKMAADGEISLDNGNGDERATNG